MEIKSITPNNLYAEQSSPEPPAQRSWKWPAFGLLLVASLIASLLLIPYSLNLVSQGQPLPAPLWLIIISSVVPNLIFSAIAIAIGLWLGQGIGLGAPVLRRWLAGDRDGSPEVKRGFSLAFGLGLAMGIVLLLLGWAATPLLPALPPGVTHPPAWQGFLASIGAGINEELWLRFGLMTLIAWIGVKLTGARQVGPAIAWTGIILATLAFGALHLPTAMALTSLTPLVVTWVLLANGLAGVLFGWLYWRWGLLAAMVAHFATDLILHVLAPALGLMS